MMKTKPGFELHSIGDIHVVVALDDASKHFNGLISLNETGAFLWERLEAGTTEEQMLADLLAEFDVDEATAQADCAEFLHSVREAGLLDE